MLVGTFQGVCPITPKAVRKELERIRETPEEQRSSFDNFYLKSAEDKRTGTHDFGFSPIWFFPMPTLADAFAKSSLTSVFNSTFFYICDIPEEELIKLDVLKHENGEYDSIVDLKTDSDDVTILEYAMDIQKLDKYPPILGVPTAICQSRSFQLLYGGIDTSEIDASFQEMNGAVLDFFERAANSSKPYPASLVPRYNSAGELDLSNIKLDIVKDAFVFTCFPFLFGMIKHMRGESFQFPVAAFASISRDMSKFLGLRFKFVELANRSDPITYAEYKHLYEGFKSMVCEDANVLIELIADEPGRNDPCPCGSGKKWKKCHGRLHHKVWCTE